MKVRKKLVDVVDIIQWRGDNMGEIVNFFKGNEDDFTFYDGDVLMNTHEGTKNARVGHFIIKNNNGEFYPCKPEIVIKTYEK